MVTSIKERPEWQQRVIVERDELKDKTDKLLIFIHNAPQFKALPTTERELLMEQHDVMEKYHKILTARIERFY